MPAGESETRCSREEGTAPTRNLKAVITPERKGGWNLPGAGCPVRWSKRGRRMNIPVLLFQRLRLTALGVLLVSTLTACPLMMPFMIPMHSGGLHGGERNVDKAAQDLVEEGVTTLAANHGPYQTIAIGEVSVRDVPMSATKFRDLMVRTLRSKGDWELVEDESRARAQTAARRHCRQKALSGS